MRHHVQEKRKQRKFSQGMVHEPLNDSSSWSVRKDSDNDTDSGKDISLIGTPGPITDPHSSVWTSPILHDLYDNKSRQQHESNVLPFSSRSGSQT